MMRKLKVGIVGCGRIAAVYRDSFKRCAEVMDLKFAADKVPGRAEEFAGAFEGAAWGRFEDILEQELDVVHICTPHFLHKDQGIQCLERGFHVLTEKPMAITLEDADQMIAAGKKSGKKLGVIFQNRYIEGIQEAKKAIEGEKLGKIVGAWSHLTWWRPPSYYACDWKGSWEKEGGGVLIDQAIHSIDLVQYMVGSRVKSIHGHMDNRVLKTVEVEDVADAVIEFENGCMYALFACNYYTSNAPIQIEIMGEKGKVNLHGFDVTIETEGEKYCVKPSPVTDAVIGGQGYWGSYHYRQIREFYRSVMEDKAVVIDGHAGKKALEIVLGVYRSSRENRKIEVPMDL